MRVDRAWGFYVDRYRSPTLVLKTLHIRPGAQTSMQFHNHRNELWFVSKGIAQARLALRPNDDQEIGFGIMKAGDMLIVPAKTWHQILNVSTEQVLVIDEMQAGELCSEDDIVRQS